ncbi:hypothetical protein Btru_021177 [Bulinus truncatus]|nr:hypothetical protein Btru_021177 [Bulinus truncatus]
MGDVDIRVANYSVYREKANESTAFGTRFPNDHWSVPDQRPDNFPLDGCLSKDIDLIFVIDCKYPIRGIDVKIRNILLNSFIVKDSENLTRTFRVSVIDLRSSENVTYVTVNTIENYDMTFVNICSSYTEESNDDRMLKRTFQTETQRLPRLIFIVQCIQYNNDIYNFWFERTFIVILKNKACNIRNNNVKSENLYVEADDEFLENNELSLLLCKQCSVGWITLRNKENDIPSCFNIQTQKRNISWKEAANFCHKKKSQLATFEDRLDLYYFKSELIKLNISFSGSGSNDLIFIGLYLVHAGDTGRLMWVNGRPVVTSIYKEMTLPTCHNTSGQVCYAWNIHDTDKVNIRPLAPQSCSTKTSAYILCKANLHLFFTVGELFLLTVPNFIRIEMSNTYVLVSKMNNLMSISNSIYLNNILSSSKSFPSFTCSQEGKLISYHYVCDGFNDCPAGEDERFCAFDESECNTFNKFICSTPGVDGKQCVSVDYRCNLIEDCPDGSDELDCDGCSGTPCNGGMCIPDQWYFNCRLQTPMNLIMAKYRHLSITNMYAKVTRLVKFITICDPENKFLQNQTDANIKLVLLNNTSMWAPRCLYLRGQFGNPLGCPDMSHLYNCKSFKCPYGFVKCYRSYCIPVYLVNDGVKDCPYEDDEIRENVLAYHYNYFKCYDSDIRIHVFQVCDGQRQCPRGDDELNCNVLCPVGFICLDGTVTVNSTMTLVDLSVLPPNTTYLNISGVDVSIVKANDKLSFIVGKILADYKVCCPLFRGPNISEHQCQSEKMSLSTCDDLIGDNLKRILLWFVAVCAVFGNAAVLVYRIFIDKATYKLTYGRFVVWLGFSDLLMGVYLVIIGTVDLYYRDVYIGHQMSWRQSALCQFSGVLATISGETSTFFIFLITFERYLTIRFPFGQYSFSKWTMNLSILLAWLLGFLLAFIPLIFQDLSLYSASGVCLGFPLRKSTGPPWIYSVVIFLFLNSLLFVIIACGQVAIFYHIHKNSAKFKNSSQHSARRAGDITVAKQLALVVMSNFICWFPVCVLGLRTVVSDFEVDRQTYAWIVAVVLPVNAALNPFLYTIPRIYKMWSDFKSGHKSSSPTTSKTSATRSL